MDTRITYAFKPINPAKEPKARSVASQSTQPRVFRKFTIIWRVIAVKIITLLDV